MTPMSSSWASATSSSPTGCFAACPTRPWTPTTAVARSRSGRGGSTWPTRSSSCRHRQPSTHWPAPTTAASCCCPVARYLRRYGGRSRLHELSEPRDAEQPGAVLRDACACSSSTRATCRPSGARRRAEREALEARRPRRIADPARPRTLCSGCSSRCRDAGVELEETHAYHIDYPGLAATREALLGLRRAAGGRGTHRPRRGRVPPAAARSCRRAVAPWGAAAGAGRPAAARARAEAQRTRPAPFLGTPPGPPAREIPRRWWPSSTAIRQAPATTAT